MKSNQKFKIRDYVEILIDNYGFKKGDVGIIKSKKRDGYEVYVPNRKSTSTLYPNVWFAEECLIKSSEESYLLGAI